MRPTIDQHSRPISIYVDQVFAPVDRDHHLERIGGGFETEVFCTDDRRFVVKLKSEHGGNLTSTLAYTKLIRRVAEEFADCLGPRHSLWNDYVISRDNMGRVQTLVLQPFIEQAQPLYKVDYRSLSARDRQHVAAQLLEILWRALRFYRQTGYMPDLYGLASASNDERLRLASPRMAPRLLWGMFTERNILRSHNLLITEAPEHRIVLVDYDLVRWPRLLRLVYFAVRWLLAWRDQAMIRKMAQSGNARR